MAENKMHKRVHGDPLEQPNAAITAYQAIQMHWPLHMDTSACKSIPGPWCDLGWLCGEQAIRCRGMWAAEGCLAAGCCGSCCCLSQATAGRDAAHAAPLCAHLPCLGHFCLSPGDIALKKLEASAAEGDSSCNAYDHIHSLLQAVDVLQKRDRCCCSQQDFTCPSSTLGSAANDMTTSCNGLSIGRGPLLRVQMHSNCFMTHVCWCLEIQPTTWLNSGFGLLCLQSPWVVFVAVVQYFPATDFNRTCCVAASRAKS